MTRSLNELKNAAILAKKAYLKAKSELNEEDILAMDEDDIEYNDKMKIVYNPHNLAKKRITVDTLMKRYKNILSDPFKAKLFHQTLFPEKYSAIAFPYNDFSDSFIYHQNSSFLITTNASGCAWVQFNFVFLEPTLFKTGNTGSQNGTSPTPNSNILYHAGSSLDGTTPLAATTYASGMTGLTALQASTTGAFNTYKMGIYI
jgi:hypothetical protein